jgi:hypothetical protein
MSEASPQMTVFREWIELVLPINVIYAGDPEPTAPRPNVDPSVTTYAAIEIEGDETGTSIPERRTTDTPGTVDPTKVDQIASEAPTGTLNVEIYGPGSVDFARTLRLSITRPDVIDLLNNAGDFAIVKAGAVGDDPVLKSATREPDASIQFDVQWVETDTFETEAVNTIETTVEVTEE